MGRCRVLYADVVLLPLEASKRPGTWSQQMPKLQFSNWKLVLQDQCWLIGKRSHKRRFFTQATSTWPVRPNCRNTIELGTISNFHILSVSTQSFSHFSNQTVVLCYK